MLLRSQSQVKLVIQYRKDNYFIFLAKNVDFENLLDSMIRYKKESPEERKADQIPKEIRDRIKRKLIKIVKLYKRELEVGLALTPLPTRFAKYVFI